MKKAVLALALVCCAVFFACESAPADDSSYGYVESAYGYVD